MKKMTRSFVFAMLGFGIYPYAIGYAQAELDGGHIKLWENSGSGDSCTLTVRPGIRHYYMGDDNGGGQCEQDQYTYFALQDMKSAVWVLFTSENWGHSPRCPRAGGFDGGWQEEIKTIKNNFTTPIIDLTVLDGAVVGEIFMPGIVKTFDRESSGVSHKGKLSCVSTFWCPASEKNLNCHDPDHVLEHHVEEGK